MNFRPCFIFLLKGDFTNVMLPLAYNVLNQEKSSNYLIRNMSMYAIKTIAEIFFFIFNKLKQTQNIQVDFSSRVAITTRPAEGLISLVP